LPRRGSLLSAPPVHHFCLSPSAQAGITNSPLVQRTLQNSSSWHFPLHDWRVTGYG
jgi:hypothetical protein